MPYADAHRRGKLRKNGQACGRRFCARTKAAIFPTPAPCISTVSRRAAKVGVAAADGSPDAPRVHKSAPEHGAHSAYSTIPNSRRGRVASPHVQGREMDLFIGIDVSKDQLRRLRPAERGDLRRHA